VLVMEDAQVQVRVVKLGWSSLGVQVWVFKFGCSSLGVQV
jgi:hypothetical protein